MKTSKLGLRFRCGVLLAFPIVVIYAAPIVQEARRGELTAPWLSIANGVLLLTAVFLFAGPVAVELLLRGRRDQLQAQGFDLRQLSLLMGVGGAAAVAGLALILVMFGGSIARANGWAAASFVVAAFWALRMRELLR